MGFRFFTTENKRHTLPPYEIFVVFLDPLIAHWFGRSPALSFHILVPGSLGIKILAIQAKFFLPVRSGVEEFHGHNIWYRTTRYLAANSILYKKRRNRHNKLVQYLDQPVQK